MRNDGWTYGGRRAVDSGVPLHAVERHEQAGSHDESEPHEDVAQTALDVGHEGKQH